jgi:hypothetical protein
MTKNYLIACAALCAACLTFAAGSAQAQETNAPTQVAPAAPAPPPPRARPARNLLYLRGAVATLDRVMADLQRNDNDFEGHRQSAIDACAKARAELAEIARQANIPLLLPGGMPGAMRRPVPPPQQPTTPPAPAQPPAQPQQ